MKTLRLAEWNARPKLAARFGLIVVLLAGSAWATFARPAPPVAKGPTVIVLGGVTLIAQTTTGNGTCDVTGVTAGLASTYQTAKNYKVPSVVVGDIAWPSCSGASLTVQLTNSASQVIGSGAATVGGTNGNVNVSTPVAMSPQPDASDVHGIFVSLQGGTTPVPTECGSMTFSSIQVGTTNNDTLTGVQQNDLIYSLPGVDSISGNNGDDCLVGGSSAGDSTTFNGGNGNNVVLSGNGSNAVTLGNGNNTIKLGNGNNTIAVGNGNNKIATGSGNDVITAGNGANVIDGGAGSNTCYLPKNWAAKSSVTHCTVVTR